MKQTFFQFLILFGILLINSEGFIFEKIKKKLEAELQPPELPLF